MQLYECTVLRMYSCTNVRMYSCTLHSSFSRTCFPIKGFETEPRIQTAQRSTQDLTQSVCVIRLKTNVRPQATLSCTTTRCCMVPHDTARPPTNHQAATTDLSHCNACYLQIVETILPPHITRFAAETTSVHAARGLSRQKCYTSVC